MKLFKTCFFSIIFILSFSVYASAETPGNPAHGDNLDEQPTEEISQQIENESINQTREQIDDLITIVSVGEYDDAEALHMIDRLHSIHDSMLQGLIEEDIAMFLVNFPITHLSEFSHLQGVVPRGWEDTGSTWDDVPGAGGKPSIARIGYSESGMDHGSLNLELHEIAHPIDTFVLNDISSSSAFQTIQKQEQPLFLPDNYFAYPNEYFAEAFAYYFLNENTREILQQNAPKTYAFIEMLGDVATMDTLKETIDRAHQVDEDTSTAELEETLDAAIAVSNNPEASHADIRKAEFTLRQAESNATVQMEERMDQLTTIVTKGPYDREEAEQMMERINRIHGSLLQSLTDHEIAIKLVNFPITELAEFSHLQGETPQKREYTDITWDEAPSISEETIAIRFDHETHDLAENSLNVELAAIGRALDRFILDHASNEAEFNRIHSAEQHAFLPESHYEDPSNYFAEAFAYYYLNDESRNELMEQAPETYDFISNLEITSDKAHLHEVIDQAMQLDEAYYTDGLKRNLTYALDISNHPYATQFKVDEAAALLYAALLTIESDVKEKEVQSKEAEEVAASSSIGGSHPTFAEKETFSYLVISLTSILFGSILLLRTFSLQSPTKMMQSKMPFQK